MHIFHSAAHRAHHGEIEFFRGQPVPCFEKPERADLVLQALQSAAIGPLCEPQPFGLAPLARVHTPRYLQFLQTAWDEWAALGHTSDAIASVWPVRGFRSDVEPQNLAARLGLYSFDTGTPLMVGTWQAARAGAELALTAQAHVAGGARAAFALTRPPGHHAGPDFFGGYCFINNAAVAAQAAVDQGAERVAVLDVDYHHGNGTQTVFYERPDVLTVSVHGDPRTEYPFYLGHADETGAGAGLGANLNLPLPARSPNEVWFDALETACQRVQAHAPELLVVALGVDTYRGDPISTFGLDTPDYRRLGQRLARLGRPTVFVLEGGYAVAEIGLNVAAVLAGFDEAAAR